MSGNGFGYSQHVFKIRRAILVWRRTHGNDLYFSEFNPGFCIRRKVNPTGFIIGFEQGFKARLKNGNVTAGQLVDSLLIDIYALDFMSHIGQHCSLYQTDVADAKNRNFHKRSPKISLKQGTTLSCGLLN